MSPESRNNELDNQIPLELLLLARTAKMIPVDDPRVAKHQEGKGGGSHHQYRNNFVMNFEALQTFIKGEEFGEFSVHKIYLQDFAKKGIPPQEFYNRHKKLCDEVFEALDGLDEYDRLLGGFIAFYNTRKFELGDRLNELVPHPLGIEAVGMYAWDRLNPLLEKADKTLKGMGIDTKGWGR
ncbi:hypothetical protein HY502_03145 [Candidatus Woesebacteria bacterium]|nr:hypothetical protein [Candidatus Woesebacteria bacterium]